MYPVSVFTMHEHPHRSSPGRANRRPVELWSVALAAVVAVLPVALAAPLVDFGDGTVVHGLSVQRDDGSSIEAYICAPEDAELTAKPVILLLQGSGCDSVFARGEGGVKVPFLFHELRRHVQDWNVVLVEKRGVTFGDDAGHSGMSRCSEDYVEHATRDGRVADAAAVLDHLSSRGLYDGSRLAVVGHSEGADVASGVAAASPAVTHLVLLGFSATHGLIDSLIADRERLRSQEISSGEFRERYDSLVEQYRAIRDDPDALEPFQGHTYRRWSSYAFGQMLDDLVRVDVPIFMGIASNDTTAPAVGADLVVAEFLRRDKANLTFRNYVGYDHGFSIGGGNRAESRRDEVLRDVLQWIDATASPHAGPSPADLPYLTFGMFLSSIEEGGRIFGPVQFLPFDHPASAGHQFPNPTRFHRAEVDTLIQLGRAIGLELWATLTRYPDPPTSDWPYRRFRVPPVDQVTQAPVKPVEGKAPIPGLRVVAVLDGSPLAFIVDTRGMTLEERGMTQPTTMGLDMTRADFLEGLAAASRSVPAEGTWIAVFEGGSSSHSP